MNFEDLKNNSIAVNKSKKNVKPKKSKTITSNNINNDGSDSDNNLENNSKVQNIINNQEKIEKSIIDKVDALKINNTQSKNTGTVKKQPVVYPFKPIEDFNNYFSILDTKNKQLVSFIDVFKTTFNEKIINEAYLKKVTEVIHNFKNIIGFLVYIKNDDYRSANEIDDIFNIIKVFIHCNLKFLENSGYVPSKKNFISEHSLDAIKTSKTYKDKNPIIYNFVSINELNVFTYEINTTMFDYLRQHYIVNIKDIIDNIYTTWYLLLLHLVICGNADESLEMKKIQDKFLNLTTDSNLALKSEINFLKRKAKKTVVSKADRINNVAVNDTLSKINPKDLFADLGSSMPSTSKMSVSNNLNLNDDDDDEEEDEE